RAGTRRRWKWLGVLSVAALLLHAAALSGVEWAWPEREAVRLPAAPMRVRLVDTALPPRESAVPVAPAARPIDAAVDTPRVAVPVPERARAPAPRAKATPPAAEPMAAAPPAAAPQAVAATAPPIDAPTAPVQLALNTPVAHPAVPVAAAPAAPPAHAPAGDEAIPHYRTRLPPPITLRYVMHRGILRGTGDLVWRPQGEHYELRFDGRVAGLAVLTQVSTGGFDAAGVAPERFTDQRLRRGTTAANFQRAAGKITFSGPATEFVLRDGAQDRLSWMVQLAAIVAAEPHLATPGAKVVMYVVGSHGDADVWSFRCIGPEAVETGAGTVDAIKFVREPREPYDTTVQVWLDPLRHDLPVRATQKSGANDEGFDLRLQETLP
ncbi:MAG: DUF3108 domain-containing protein, partial [Burkholderiales bacterium]|nr:DUF3108 domain-containing protein [Burkholderiales bacterium]